MAKIGYVILHYNTIDETEQCIESILHFIDDGDVIIVVDNASTNSTGRILAEKYVSFDNINVVINDENLGFAKGNNVGIKIAVEKYECDFVAVMNNDIIIKQMDFKKNIVDAYSQYSFAVMGPKIFDSFGRVYEYNPRKAVFTKKIQVIRGLLFNYIRFVLSYIGIDNIFNILLFNVNDEKRYDLVSENMRIHGCCFILSRLYLDKYPDGLNPDTFLFLEEDVLYIRCKNANLKILYYPYAEVIHYEHTSLKDAISKKDSKIRRFRYYHQAKSFLALYREIKNGEKNE